MQYSPERPDESARVIKTGRGGPIQPKSVFTCRGLPRERQTFKRWYRIFNALCHAQADRGIIFLMGADFVGIKEEAVRLHGEGFNCAQCVLCACGKYTGLDENTALAVSGGFGGGVRCGEICGAISGAVMSLGCAAPYSDGADREARDRIARLTKECTAAFREKYGVVRCLDLKRAGVDCDELIAFGAETVEKILSESK